MTAPTLADGLRVGDKLQVTPVWETADGHAPPPPQPGVVEYIHPAGRYCIVRLPNGITETVQTIPETLLASKAAKLVEPPQVRPNQGVRDYLQELGVPQTAVSVALGHGPTWLNRRLESQLEQGERLRVLNAAKHVAALRQKEAAT